MTAPQVVAARAKPKSASTAEKTKNATVRQQSQQNQNGKLKVVVRGLPPNLPESKFKETTAQWINENTVEWYYYVTGKIHERDNKPSVRSRAYAKFKSVEALADFHKAFNGHIFTDSKGRSSRVVIEFAPFQKYVKGKTKPDARQGTIEDSPEYKEFLASLNQPVPAESHVSNAEDGPKTTPLIEYIRTLKAARAEKDKINKEKLRLARVAATQAKANAQTAKLRAERMQKAETGGKPVENGKDARRPAAKSGATRPKDQRPKGQAQPPKNMEKIAEAPVAEGSGTPVARMQMRNAPAHNPDTPIDANGSGAFRGRGRGARGGKARPHGVYKPGSGRGGRRGGGVNEASSSGTVGNG